VILVKIIYGLKSAYRWQNAGSFRCTNCGSKGFVTVDSKYLVTSLRRCRGCSLMYRVPPDDARDNFDFYQETYRQGFTTELPDDVLLAELIANKFQGTGRSYDSYIGILRALGLEPGAKIFDYGCSWGYGSWQLSDAGYNVTAFEISKRRARYAREKLAVKCISDMSEVTVGRTVQSNFDCFFSGMYSSTCPVPSLLSVLQERHFARAASLSH
jgi:hypothetical protein